MNKLAAIAVFLVLTSCHTQIPVVSEAEPDASGDGAEVTRIAEAQPPETRAPGVDVPPQSGAEPSLEPGAARPDERPGSGPPPGGILGAGSSRSRPQDRGGLPLPAIREPGAAPGADSGPPAEETPPEAPGNRRPPGLPLPKPPGDTAGEEEPRLSLDPFPAGGLLGVLEIEAPDYSPAEIAAVPAAPEPPDPGSPPPRRGSEPQPEPERRREPRPEPEAAAGAPQPAGAAARGAMPEAAARPADRGGAEPDAARGTAAPAPRREPRPEPRGEPDRAEAAAAGPVDGRSTVTVGEEVRLRLADGGWVYLGEESGDDGLSYRRRFSDDGDTVFIFSADAAGEYVARFQRQDLDQGVFRERRLAVKAVPQPASGGGMDGAVAQVPAGDETAPGAGDSAAGFGMPEDSEAPDLDAAYALLEEGRRAEALDAFLQSYPPGDAEVHDTIASLARDLGRTETARSHWSENLDSQAPWARRARLGLFRTELGAGNGGAAWEHYAALEDAGAASATAGAAPGVTAEELLELGALLFDSNNRARALDPLEAYLGRGGTPENPAQLYYRLGRLYEERRDARAAHRYYRRVVDDFPLSEYWEPAEARIQYLRRHFFDIR